MGCLKTLPCLQTMESKVAELNNVISSVCLVLDVELGQDADSDSIVTSIRSKVESLNSEEKSKSSELLTELNAMNVELKLRGEKISEYESRSSSMARKMEEMQEQIDSSNSKMSMQNTKIQSLQLKLETAAAPTAAVKEAPSDVKDDSMSSSTALSKAEDEGRMQDVENSFEDRYTLT